MEELKCGYKGIIFILWDISQLCCGGERIDVLNVAASDRTDDRIVEDFEQL